VIVDRIRTLDAFDRLRESYEAVYERDPYRTVFASWAWLRAYFVAMRRSWLLLAARRGREYVGYCLLVEHGIRVGPLRFYRELAVGAYPTADYSGLAIAEGEEDAIDAFAGEIARMRWDTLRASNIRDPRVSRLMARLQPRNTFVEEPQNVCRFLELPAGCTRYARRRRNAWNDARFVEADDDSIDAYIETLLRFHHARWNSNARKARRTYGRLFREAYRRGCCRVGVLWSAEKKPLAAQAAFVDPERRSWGVYMLAHDRSVRRGSPGIAMLAYGLEHAAAQGFREYDFLRGDEPYKASFGARVRTLQNFVVRRAHAKSRAAERAWYSALDAKSHLRRMLFGRTL
jgi:CelD/BcsL family acetyltransferase involved in cellulose biosynthesis